MHGLRNAGRTRRGPKKFPQPRETSSDDATRPKRATPHKSETGLPMKRTRLPRTTIGAAIAAWTSFALAQEIVDLTAEELVDPPRELVGAKVRVDGGRIFAATPRSAALKIDGVYLPLSFDEAADNGMPWQNCRGLEPVDECRISVTGTLIVRSDAAGAELHDVAAER